MATNIVAVVIPYYCSVNFIHPPQFEHLSRLRVHDASIVQQLVAIYMYVKLTIVFI